MTTNAPSTVTRATGGMNLIGVSLSGGEYGTANAPGDSEGTTYIYPSKAEINYYASEGMTVLRVPFLLERLEPSAGAPLNQTQVADLQQVIAEAAADGMDVILDPHDYGDAWGHQIGGTAAGDTTNAQFANFWGDMATAFAKDPNVIFGLMNEPNTQTPTQWEATANAAIAAIRHAGASQEILVPGTDWDGAWTWISSGNAAAINPSTIIDPDHNWAIEVHQYLDPDGSGTNYSPITDPNIGVERLTAITQWAEANGAKLFLGETGVPGDAQSLKALQNMLGYMEANASVWQGAAYWAGGQWLGSYPLSIEPTGLGTSSVINAAQMSVLHKFVPGGSLSAAPAPGSAGTSGGAATTTSATAGGASGTIEDLTVTGPAREVLTAGQTVAIGGVSIADVWAAGTGGTMALNVWDKSGTLKIAGDSVAPGGGEVPGGMFAGTLAQLNADLATLTYTAAATSGTDTITVDVWNQAGVEVDETIPVTIAPAAVSASTGDTASSSGTTSVAVTTTAASAPAPTTPAPDTITIAAGDTDPVELVSNAVISANVGNHLLFIGGTGNTVTMLGGVETVQALQGGNTITTGAANDTIEFAGSGNTINAGAGNNTLRDNGSDNTIVMPGAGKGFDDVFGYVLANGDTLDFRAALETTMWNGSAATIGSFLHVAEAGESAMIAISTTAGGTATNVAELQEAGAVSLTTLLAHATI